MHWYCDICGRVIRRAEDAYLTANHQLTHWSIVHARSECDVYRDGPWHPLDDFYKPGPVIREMLGIHQGAKLWRRMVRDGAFRALDADELEVLRLRVFAGDGRNNLSAPQPRERPAPETMGLTLRFRVFKRDGYRCQICGRTAQDGARLEVDHKHPRSLGGTNDPANLWTLCFECNRGKRDTLL